MTAILGIDIGSSSTKIVALDENKTLLASANVSAGDQVTALFGAIGKLLYDGSIDFNSVSKIMMTGVGASVVKGDVHNLPTERVTEFEALGRGGLFLSGLSEAVIGSIGTGTALVNASQAGVFSHVGGSAVGGGTLVGLSKRLFGISDVEVIAKMAEKGNLEQVDWGINEVSSVEMSTLPDYATASNLGKMRVDAADEDVALGILNMIFQTVGTMAVFACRQTGSNKAVMVGTLPTLAHARLFLGRVGMLYGIDFIIPEQAAYATAIGAALTGLPVD